MLRVRLAAVREPKLEVVPLASKKIQIIIQLTKSVQSPACFINIETVNV